MKLASISFALVAFFTTYVYAAALPDLSAIDIAKRATEPTLDPQVLSSLATWFGWQLAGGATNKNELVCGCEDLDEIGGKKWAQIGLVPANIRQPLCNASHSNPNPEVAFPNSIPAISAIIERQLVGSFTTRGAYAYLCDNLAFFQIDQFYLTDTKLLQAVCSQAGKQVPPRPFGSDAGRLVSQAAAFAARNTATILYTTLLAAGAESSEQLNALCAHGPAHIAQLNAEKLNGTLMASELCSFKTPLDVNQVRSRILSWTSRLFITVLENIGDGDGWLDWLCENLDEEGMNGVGLIGWGSKQQVCNDARTGLPTEVVPPEGIFVRA